MFKFKVVNKYKTEEPFEYCGRGSPLGNPFGFTHTGIVRPEMQQVANREEAVSCFEIYFRDKLKTGDPVIADEIKRLLNLIKVQDVNLCCYCAPKKCHCDVLERYLTYMQNKTEEVKILDLKEQFKLGLLDVVINGCSCSTLNNGGTSISMMGDYDLPDWLLEEIADLSRLGNIRERRILRPDLPIGYIVDIYIQVDAISDTSALRVCLRKIKDKYQGLTIGIPDIDSPIADKIKSIIGEELIGMDYTYVRRIYDGK